MRSLSQVTDSSEGRTSRFCSRCLVPFYGITSSPTIRSLVRRAVIRLEAGSVYSMTIREIFRRYHKVEVGLYTIGPCETEPGNLAPGTIIGRYSSIYYTVRTIVRNDPMRELFPWFPQADDMRSAPDAKLVIGNDVWIGHNAIVLAGVKRIGDGAVVGAGSVLHKEVPPYAVVTGNPARVVRYRFSEKKIKELLESRWWMKSSNVLEAEIEEFQKPVESEKVLA